GSIHGAADADYAARRAHHRARYQHSASVPALCTAQPRRACHAGQPTAAADTGPRDVRGTGGAAAIALTAQPVPSDFYTLCPAASRSSSSTAPACCVSGAAASLVQPSSSAPTHRYAATTNGDGAMPICSLCMRPKKVRAAPATAKPAALKNSRSIMNTAIAASTRPPSVAPLPSVASPEYNTP